MRMLNDNADEAQGDVVSIRDFVVGIVLLWVFLGLAWWRLGR